MESENEGHRRDNEPGKEPETPAAMASGSHYIRGVGEHRRHGISLMPGVEVAEHSRTSGSLILMFETRTLSPSTSTCGLLVHSFLPSEMLVVVPTPEPSEHHRGRKHQEEQEIPDDFPAYDEDDPKQEAAAYHPLSHVPERPEEESSPVPLPLVSTLLKPLEYARVVRLEVGNVWDWGLCRSGLLRYLLWSRRPPLSVPAGRAEVRRLGHWSAAFGTELIAHGLHLVLLVVHHLPEASAAGPAEDVALPHRPLALDARQVRLVLLRLQSWFFPAGVRPASLRRRALMDGQLFSDSSRPLREPRTAGRAEPLLARDGRSAVRAEHRGCSPVASPPVGLGDAVS